MIDLSVEACDVPCDECNDSYHGKNHDYENHDINMLSTKVYSTIEDYSSFEECGVESDIDDKMCFKVTITNILFG